MQRFVASELAFRSFHATQLPDYSDKHGVFRVNNKDAVVVMALHSSAAHCRA